MTKSIKTKKKAKRKQAGLATKRWLTKLEYNRLTTKQRELLLCINSLLENDKINAESKRTLRTIKKGVEGVIAKSRKFLLTAGY